MKNKLISLHNGNSADHISDTLDGNRGNFCRQFYMSVNLLLYTGAGALRKEETR